ncbi:MAG: 2,3,4,5-tetrahydropyridine-2,6-dicarboxylate N-succinyltransferase [Pseudohongiellaceae bacterium]
MIMKLYSFAFGMGTRDSQNNWLEVYYPQPLLQPDHEWLERVASVAGYSRGNATIELDREQLQDLQNSLGADSGAGKLLGILKQSTRPVVAVFLAEDLKPETVPEVYLKLHLLSHRLVKPHTTNLDGMFAVLPNVAWTSQGAIAIAELPQRQSEARAMGQTLEVNSVDKFPKMTDYVVPEGVRIADTARVRLGAYVGAGTTVMHEGFINFNAGTEGKAMIEGRITAGVMVGEGSDLGGGASILGTLSGGGKVLVSIGRDSLVGANAGVGFPLGDRCIVEAGLYVTAGTKVTLLDQESKMAGIVKARELAFKNDLLFRRNSTTGAVECLTNKTRVELNTELHAHN